jgi:hypothetical protein
MKTPIQRSRFVQRLILLCMVEGTANAITPGWDVAVVSEAELTSMRGGVALPDGLNLDIGIDVQTQVNGRLVLHTVLSTAAPAAAQLRVFTGGPAPSNSGARADLGIPDPPTLLLNRSGSSTTLLPGGMAGNPNVLVLNAPTNTWPQYPDEKQLNVVANGSPVSTANGSVEVQRTGGNTSVTLTGDGLTIQHLLGNSTGVAVTNQLNNQTIQSMTVVDVDLHGAWPAAANAMFNVGNLAIAAARRF